MSTVRMSGEIFKITGLARDDVLALFPDCEREIAEFGDDDMEYIARKMADGYLECCFWIQLRYLGEELLAERRRQRDEAGGGG